jgi:hypothetical protein
MPQLTRRRAPLATGRRVPLTVTVDLDTYIGLKALGNGNRSAAIEHLYRAHMAHQRAFLADRVDFAAAP